MMDSKIVLFWSAILFISSFFFWSRVWWPRIAEKLPKDTTHILSALSSLITALTFALLVVFLDSIDHSVAFIFLIGTPIAVSIAAIIQFMVRVPKFETPPITTTSTPEKVGEKFASKETSNKISQKSEPVVQPETWKRIATFGAVPIVALLLYYYGIGTYLLQFGSNGSFIITVLLAVITVYAVMQYPKDSQKSFNAAMWTILGLIALKFIRIYAEEIQDFFVTLLTGGIIVLLFIAWITRRAKEPSREIAQRAVVTVSPVGVCRSCGKIDGTSNTNYPGWRVSVRPYTINGQLTYLCQKCSGKD